MNPEQLLGLVGEHRDSIHAALDGEQYALLLARLGALAEAAEADPKAVRRALQGVRLALVPLPLDHPVRVALDSVRLAGPAIDMAVVAGARTLLERLSQPPPVPDTAVIIRAAQARLLAAPVLDLSVVRARCHSAGLDEPPPELIRLDDAERGDRYPAFQFAGAAGGPIPVVLRVNRILVAGIDPWGAADWWLSGNVQLGGKPAALLGELPDEQLIGAATALVEGD
ncbi:hypothetical protein AQI95_14960 [Streptomyces yokosukanensis]|uniref:Uncharacterized protein n=1 Tax=Streptomyces yokosukanensis TaxID=67386 RepID=A0A124HG81_9ACTN|nr:hypothetical protein [Streptomyces yokosukanensis]KUN06192.1 hypothetical protein AQI95_14960 [Streptomyces yokosukanensis]